jgi:NAD-dependent SIR2 family protein deacetylase
MLYIYTTLYLIIIHYTHIILLFVLVAGLPQDKIIEAHGTFSTASCIRCHRKYDGDTIKV